MSNRNAVQAGFTLIEVLVALGLTAFIFLACLPLVQEMCQISLRSDRQAEERENLSYALAAMTREIRQALWVDEMGPNYVILAVPPLTGESFPYVYVRYLQSGHQILRARSGYKSLLNTQGGNNPVATNVATFNFKAVPASWPPLYEITLTGLNGSFLMTRVALRANK